MDDASHQSHQRQELVVVVMAGEGEEGLPAGEDMAENKV